MKSCIIIRTNTINDDVNEKLSLLKQYFNKDVYVFVENYKNQNLYTYRDNNIITIGKQFLLENNLAYFAKCGWQCGDYILYAASELLKDYDYFWMTEPDLSFTVNIIDFFRKFESINDDLLGVAFGSRKKNWTWHKSAEIISSEVKGLYFPFLRVSSNALLYAFNKRKEYSSLKQREGIDFSTESMIKDFANDESFIATTIYNNEKFKCSSLNKIVQNELDGLFSTHLPVLKEELGKKYAKNKIIHPVLDDKDKIKAKFNEFFYRFKNEKIISRMEQIICSFSEEYFENLTGISVSEIRLYYLLSENAIDFSWMNHEENPHFIKNMLLDYFKLAKLKKVKDSITLLLLYIQVNEFLDSEMMNEINIEVKKMDIVN